VTKCGICCITVRKFIFLIYPFQRLPNKPISTIGLFVASSHSLNFHCYINHCKLNLNGYRDQYSDKNKSELSNCFIIRFKRRSPLCILHRMPFHFRQSQPWEIGKQNLKLSFAGPPSLNAPTVQQRTFV